MVTQIAASNALHAAADEAGDEASTTLRKLREQTDAVVQRLRPQIDAVSDYARDEPTKALLISAATGAALMAIVAMLARSPSRSEQVRDSASGLMSTIRDAALDLADRAHNAADGAIATGRRYLDTTQQYVAQGQKEAKAARKKAEKAAEKAQSRASSATEGVSDSVSEAWQSLRDQAAPVIDKLRPRIDAMTSYAKDEPARTALGLAAAAAVLAGLMALINKSED